jgi:hypothetical protein
MLAVWSFATAVLVPSLTGGFQFLRCSRLIRQFINGLSSHLLFTFWFHCWNSSCLSHVWFGRLGIHLMCRRKILLHHHCCPAAQRHLPAWYDGTDDRHSCKDHRIHHVRHGLMIIHCYVTPCQGVHHTQYIWASGPVTAG